MADKPPAQVGQFTVLPLTIPAQPSFPHKTTHYLYLRAHEPAIPSADSPRSLFLTNIPTTATPAHFRALFARQSLGGARVESVEFEDSRPKAKTGAAGAIQQHGAGRKRKRGGPSPGGADEELRPALPEVWDRNVHRSGATAVVVFVDRASAEAALKGVKRAVRRGEEVVWDHAGDVEGGDGVAKAPRLGLARYKAHHALRFPDRDTLLGAVEAYMVAFGEMEKAKARAAKKKVGVPDEDGFVTVTRGSRGGGAASLDAARAEELREKMAAKKRKEEEKREGLDDFYRFQVRERKKAQAGELVKKFDEDRKRVGMMKARDGRRFRPET